MLAKCKGVRTLLHSPTISATDTEQIFVEKFSGLQNSNVRNGKDKNPENLLPNSIYIARILYLLFSFYIYGYEVQPFASYR